MTLAVPSATLVTSVTRVTAGQPPWLPTLPTPWLAGQDVEWIDDGAGGGVWRIARKVAHDRVISTVDTETRHAHKSGVEDDPRSG